MKKTLIAFALILCLMLSSGCYHTRASKISKIVGTYELITYSEDGVDMIAKYDMQAYLVVNNEGKSYYYLRRGEYVSLEEINLRFIPDEEESGKYSYIEYQRDTSSEWEMFGYADDGFNAHRRRYTGGLENLKSYDIYINYKKVSKVKDLSYLSSKVSNLPKPLEFGKNLYDGIYNYEFIYNNFDREKQKRFNEYFDEEFVYWFIDLNLYTGKATTYTMQKSDEVSKETQSSFTLGESNNLSGFNIEGFNSLGERKAYTEKSSGGTTSSYSIYLYIPGSFEYEGESFEFYYVFAKNYRYHFDIEYQMQYRIDYYNSTKPQEPTE